MLSDRQITHCFTFAKKCTKNVFKQVFQYKIGVNILPTNEYLFRYKVLENNICGKCQDGEVDSIMHSLWECVSIQPFLTQVLRNINTWTGREVDMVDFLFGLDEPHSEGINHYALEAKMFTFYNWKEKVEREEEDEEVVDRETIQSKLIRFHCKVRRVIKTEKHIAVNMYSTDDRREKFYEKWENFCEIYQIFGPDNLEV